MPFRQVSKPPLYRKVNTKARGVRHRSGGDFSHERHSKKALSLASARSSMHGKVQRWQA